MPAKCKRKRKYKKPYDWEKIKEDYLTSEFVEVKAFCKARGITYATATRHLKAKTKEKLTKKSLKENCKPFGELDSAQNGAELVERRRVYLASLEQATETARKIQEQALSAFEEAKVNYRSRAEAGNLALRAAEQRREFASELQGIPRDQEEHIWPLTKGFWPLSYQRDFIFDFPGELERAGKKSFVFAFIGGLGAGKTYCGGEKFGVALERNRGLPSAIYAPTYRMLEDSTKKKFFDVLTEKGLSFRYHATDKIVTVFGDTPVMLRSMDDPQHLRGPEIACAWIDEGLQMPTREPFDIIMGRIRHPDAKEKMLIFTGTPNGLNWGYDLLVEEAEEHHVRLYVGRTDQNIYLDPRYYQRLLKLYDERMVEQELHAQFVDVHKGRAYWAFDRTINVIQTETYKTDEPLDLCVDFNVSPMAWNVTQDFMARGDMVTYVQDEIHIDDTNTQAAAQEFCRRYQEHERKEVRIFGDATGRNRATNATRSDYEIIKQVLEADGWTVDVRVGRSNPAVTDRVNSVNARLKNARGEHRLFIHERCKETIIDFERVAFKPGTRELDKREKKDGSFSHHTDAIGYKIDRLYPVRKIEIGNIREHLKRR